MFNKNWVFGDLGGLTFTANQADDSVLFPINNDKFTANEGCASISDNNGSLLFYTDGRYIWKYDGFRIVDNSGNPIELDGDDTSSQSAIIVPDLSNENKYYIFTMDGNSSNPSTTAVKNLNIYLIDTSNWSVDTTILTTIQNSSPSFERDQYNNTPLSPAEKLTAVKSSNCNNIWVLALHQLGQNDTGGNTRLKGLLRIFKVDLNGVQHHTDIELGTDVLDRGYMKVSHDSKTLAIANSPIGSLSYQKVLLYDFDDVNGLLDVNSLREINFGYNQTPYGIEFSPNNKFLYISTWNRPDYEVDGYIFQIDLENNTYPLTVNTVNTSGNYYFKKINCGATQAIPQNTSGGLGLQVLGALQMGPNNKIYIARKFYDKIGVINRPDLVGAGCDIAEEAINISGMCMLGLPNFITNSCVECSCGCSCGSCCDCNKNAENQNKELIERAKQKTTLVKSDVQCLEPFLDNCTTTIIAAPENLEPCFYLHYNNNNIPSTSAQKIYITVCNPFADIQFNSLQLTKITLVPQNPAHDNIYITPDGLVFLDCLQPCSCKSREFALINENTEIVDYKLEVEYCYDSITITTVSKGGTIELNPQ